MCMRVLGRLGCGNRAPGVCVCRGQRHQQGVSLRMVLGSLPIPIPFPLCVAGPQTVCTGWFCDLGGTVQGRRKMRCRGVGCSLTLNPACRYRATPLLHRQSPMVLACGRRQGCKTVSAEAGIGVGHWVLPVHPRSNWHNVILVCLQCGPNQNSQDLLCAPFSTGNGVPGWHSAVRVFDSSRIHSQHR